MVFKSDIQKELRMQVEIDEKSGFCSGVKRVVKLAEEGLKEGKHLKSLGEIVHNKAEVDRLSEQGMNTISGNAVDSLSKEDILIRAHGEPPATYEKLEKGENTVIDGTCPVVLAIQKKIRKAYQEAQQCNGRIWIYGKTNHPEVIGLVGQTNGEAQVFTHLEDLAGTDFSKPVFLFSQTTMSIAGFKDFQLRVKEKMTEAFGSDEPPLQVFDTICRQVANREPHLKEFAKKHQLIIFVGGANSSNGKVLFDACCSVNKQSYFVSNAEDLRNEWFENVQNVGICGATSTPLWQMENVKDEILKRFNENFKS